MKRLFTLYLLILASFINLSAEQLNAPLDAIYSPSLQKYFVVQEDNRILTLETDNLEVAELFQTFEYAPSIAEFDRHFYVGEGLRLHTYRDGMPNNAVSGDITLSDGQIKSLAVTSVNGNIRIYAIINNIIYSLSEVNALGLITATELQIPGFNDQIVNIRAKGTYLYISTVTAANDKSKFYTYNLVSNTLTIRYDNGEDLSIASSAVDNQNNIYVAFSGNETSQAYIMKLSNNSTSAERYEDEYFPYISSISYRQGTNQLLVAFKNENAIQLLDITNNRPTRKVTLLEPVNKSKLNDNKVVFKWEPVEEAVRYILEVSEDMDFQSPLVNKEFEQNRSSIYTLEYSKAYYWRVKAIPTSGQFIPEWSDIFSFKLEELKLEAPVTISPANDEKEIALNPIFVWHKYLPNYQYEIQVSSDANFNDVIRFAKNILDTTYTFTNKLNENTTYYWRVRTYTNIEKPSPWSNVVKFTTILESPPPAPELVYPQFNEVNVALKPLFQWRYVENTTSYKLEISKDINFIDEANTYRYTVTPDGQHTQSFQLEDEILVNYTHYYWRVKANTSYGNSEWSKAWRFQTINQNDPDPDPDPGEGSVFEFLDNNLLFPLPANDNLFIKKDQLFIGNQINIKIFNIFGQEIKDVDFSITNDYIKLNLISLSKGMYNIIIETDNKIFLSKFIKN